MLEVSSLRSSTDKPTTLDTSPVSGLPSVANSESLLSSPFSPSTSACATSKQIGASVSSKVQTASDTLCKGCGEVGIKSQVSKGDLFILRIVPRWAFLFSPLTYVLSHSSYVLSLLVSKQTNGNTNPSNLSTSFGNSSRENLSVHFSLSGRYITYSLSSLSVCIGCS